MFFFLILFSIIEYNGTFAISPYRQTDRGRKWSNSCKPDTISSEHRQRSIHLPPYTTNREIHFQPLTSRLKEASKLTVLTMLGFWDNIQKINGKKLIKLGFCDNVRKYNGKKKSDFRHGYSTGRRKLGPALNNLFIHLNPLLFYITAESKCKVLDYQGSWNRQ